MTYDEALGTITSCRELRPIRSRYGGQEAFEFDGKEIAHFHGRHEIDLRLARYGIGMLKSTHPHIFETANVRTDWISLQLARIDTGDLAYMLVLLRKEVR